MPTMEAWAAAAPPGESWFQETPLVMEISYRRQTRAVRQEKASHVMPTPLTHAKVTHSMVGIKK